MAEVPPFLWADAGDFDSPKQYEVPGSGEVQPYTATATYVNASGQAILPALRIKSDTGNLLTLTFPVGQTIADGDSSEVTFVPPFGSAQGSGGGTATTPNEWCALHSNGTTNPLAYNHFTTSNAAVFSTSTGGAPQVVSNASGDENLLLLADGIYLILGWAIITDTVSGTERWLQFNPSGNVDYIGNDLSQAWGELGQLGIPIPGWFNSNFVGGGSSPGLFNAELVRIDSTISNSVKYFNFGFGTTGTISAMNFQCGAYFWPAPTGRNLY